MSSRITGRTRRTPRPGETATLLDVDPNNPTGPGKPFFLNSKPFLLDVKVENATDPGKGAKGSLSDNFKFSVKYGDNGRDTPAGDLLELVIDGQDVHQMVRDPAQPDPDYAAGVIYTVTLNGRRDRGRGALLHHRAKDLHNPTDEFRSGDRAEHLCRLRARRASSARMAPRRFSQRG